MLLILLSLGNLAGLIAAGWLAYRLRATIDRVEMLHARLERLETAPKTTPSSRPRSEGWNPPRKRRADKPSPRGKTLITIPDLAATHSAPSQSDDLARRYGSIWDLAEAGVSPEAIARETGQPIGQVELILGLKNPRAASGSGVA